MVVTDRVELSRQARDFLLASIRRDRRRRGRSTAILSTLLVLAVLAAGAAFSSNSSAVQQRAAEERQRLATARLLLTRAEATLASDPRTALRLAEAADRIHPDQETQAGLVHLWSTPASPVCSKATPARCTRWRSPRTGRRMSRSAALRTIADSMFKRLGVLPS